MNSRAVVAGADERLSTLTRALSDVVCLAKPRITVMVVVTGSAGMWLARRLTGADIAWGQAVATLLGLALVVASANAFNMVIERERDAKMDRTKERPLPAGRLAPAVALAFAGSWAAFSLPLLWSSGPVAAGLSLGALALYVLVYTPLKGHTSLALAVGAVPGALPPLIGWAAVTGGLEAPGLILFGILFFWQLPHFLAIATFRRDDYVRAGIQVTPAVHGDRATRLLAVAYSMALTATSLGLGAHGVGLPYLVVAAIFGFGLVALSAAGLTRRGRTAEGGDRWARLLFLSSLVYLPVLLGAMILSA
jgi:heme o synthase